MSSEPTLEREVLAAFREAAPSREPERLYEAIISTTSRTRQRPRWLALMKEPPMRLSDRVAVGSPMVRLTTVLLATLAIAVALAGAVVAGASMPPSPPPNQPVPPPTPVTGRIAFGDYVESGTMRYLDGSTESRGSVAAPSVVTMSDPRLDGDVLISWQYDAYPGADGGEVALGTGTWRIETADGAWQGSYPRLEAEGISDSNTAVLVGEGAYEGLITVWEQTIDYSGWDIAGAIFAAGPPPAAELP